MSSLSYTGGGAFATSRRCVIDDYAIKQAGDMLKRSPGAYQSTSLATGVPIARLKEMFPHRERSISVRPLARVVSAAERAAHDALADDPLEAGERSTVGQVINAVIDYYDVSRTDLLSARRERRVTRPRQVAMWLCRELTKASLPEIGRRLGGRDHTTILSGSRKIEQDRIEDDKLQADLDHLRAVLASDTTSVDLAIADHLAAIRDLEALKARRQMMAKAA